jgi:WD40 repeat protein
MSSITRYAHLEGYTDICLAEDGKFITTGEDGEVRIWNGFEDVDSTSINISDKCSAIGYKCGTIYVADDLNEVKRYDMKTNELQGVITSFTLPCTCITINKSNTHALCGSADFDIHLIELSTLKFSSFAGHDAPILHLCFDPLEKYFLSSSCDGTVRFWSIQNLCTVKTLSNIHPKANDFIDSPTFGKAAWHKDGALICIPSEKELQFYERETWYSKFKIQVDNAGTGDSFLVSIVCFSPDGKNVLACTNTYSVFIHAIISKAILYKYSYSKKAQICSLVWSAQDDIIFCDMRGFMGLIKPTIKDQLNETSSSASATSKVALSSATNSKLISKFEQDENLKIEDLLNLIDSNEEASNDSAVGKQNSIKSAAKEKSESKKEGPSTSNIKLVSGSKQEAGKKRKRLENDDPEEKKSKSCKSKKITDESDEVTSTIGCIEDEYDENSEMGGSASAESVSREIDDSDEENVISLEKLKKKTYNSIKKEVMSSMKDNASNGDEEEEDTMTVKSDELEKHMLLAKKAKELQQQDRDKEQQQVAFQPSSTPLNLDERYMVWNSIGVITQYNKEGDESIEIEFHNASYHHTIHVKNHLGHTMADMSKEVVVLACPGQQKSNENDDNELESAISLGLAASSASRQSKLVCILINSWDGNKEWTITMPRKEYIKCVCASNMFVACATNNKFLRVFSIGGMQKELIAIGGAPLCMSAHSNRIFVCYLTSSSGDAHSVGYSLIYTSRDDAVNFDFEKAEPEHGSITLSDKAKLSWVGFSDEGTPYYCDSNGYLYTKYIKLAKKNLWTPISNLRANLAHKSDNYWIIGVGERNQMIKAILCKCAKYPRVLPRPSMSTLNFSLPLCETDTERAQIEQEYWKSKLIKSNIESFASEALRDERLKDLNIDEDDLAEIIETLNTSIRDFLMKLFIQTCKAGKEQRAFEISTHMDLIALELAIKYATKTRALQLAQKLNMLAENKTSIEYEKNRKLQELESSHDREEIAENKTSIECEKNRKRQELESSYDKEERQELESSSNRGETQEIEISSDREEISRETPKQAKSQHSDSLRTWASCATPTSIPLTTTRMNPFKANNQSANKSAIPLNDSSKSIINEIEDKLNKQSLSASKEKDCWKPTPTRKLVKNKISNPISSFFGANQPAP